MPAWRESFEIDDTQVLDQALTGALGDGNVCRLDGAIVAAGEQKAREDIAELAGRRRRRFVEFDERPGWRLVVEADEGEPLRPRGFDPQTGV